MHLIHDLDMIRHGFAFSWAWYNWITNVTAGVVTFAFASLFWPRARKAYKGYFERHIKSIHDKMDDHHEKLLAQAEGHHEQHMEVLATHHAAVLKAVTPAKPVAKKAVPVRKAQS